jgi:hypothetical protein
MPSINTYVAICPSGAIWPAFGLLLNRVLMAGPLWSVGGEAKTRHPARRSESGQAVRTATKKSPSIWARTRRRHRRPLSPNLNVVAASIVAH